MENQNNDQLVAEVARDLLAEIAPQEKALFRAISESYFKEPTRSNTGQRGGDELLGFGAAEAVTLITPALLAALGEVVRFLLGEAHKAMQTEGSTLVNDTVKSWFGKLRPEEKKKEPPPLTDQQLEQVRKIAVKKAQQLKLSEKNSKLLADAIVGSLATK